MNPILLLLGIGALLGWLTSDEERNLSPDASLPDNSGGNPPLSPPGEDASGEETSVSQPITLLMLREIFENGARPLRRRDAVEILKAAPYHVPKSNAYRALAPSRRFELWLFEDENGCLHFVP